jgi:hypothetical protein
MESVGKLSIYSAPPKRISLPLQTAQRRQGNLVGHLIIRTELQRVTESLAAYFVRQVSASLLNWVGDTLLGLTLSI